MKKYYILAVLVLAIFVVACGSGEDGETGIQSSGLSAELYLDELATDEQQTFCTWYVDLFGGEGKSYECEVSEEDLQAGMVYPAIDIPTIEECKSGAQLKNHCLLGDAEACFKATAGDPCKMMTNEECKNINECVAGQSNAPDNACGNTKIKCYCTASDCDYVRHFGCTNPPNGTVSMPSCKIWWFFCSPSACSGYQEGDYNQACKDAGHCESCDGGVCTCAGDIW